MSSRTKSSHPKPRRSPCDRDAGHARVDLILVLLTITLFLPVVDYAFLNYDDPDYVTANPHVLGGLTLDNIRWAFTSAHAANWHPLTWLSHMADVSLFGPSAGRHHMTSVVLHALSAGLLLVVLQRMTRRLWPSAFVAALFALHPLHVESVAWIAERKDVLSGLFFVLALGAYALYAERPSVLRYIAVAILFALGLMAKPMLVTFPFLLLLLDVWPLRRLAIPTRGWHGDTAGVAMPTQHAAPGRHAGRHAHAKSAHADAPTDSPATAPSAQSAGATLCRPGAAGTRVCLSLGRLILEKLPLFALAAASAVVTFLVQQSAGAVRLHTAYPLATRLANAALACIRYIYLTIFPARLSFFYPYPNAFPAWQVALAVALLVTLTVAALYAARRNRPWLAVGWLWFLGMLVPVIGLVQVGDQAMADRYTYLPLIGLFIAVAFAFADAADRHRRLVAPIVVAAVVAVAALAFVTRTQLACWTDSFALTSQALAVDPDNSVAHNNLADILMTQGRYEDAELHYRRAADLRPREPRLQANIGATFLHRNRPTDAEPFYRQAVRLDPAFARGYSGLGAALALQGRLDEAVTQYREAIRLDPADPVAWQNLADALYNQRRYAEALEAARRALELARSAGRSDLVAPTEALIRQVAAALSAPPAPPTP